MDWTKAKTILILALVVTNLVLLAAYYMQNKPMEDTDEMETAAIKLLAENNIFLKTDIPKERKMPKLTVQYDTINEDVVNEQLSLQTAVSTSELTDEKLIEMTSDFIMNCGLMSENVMFDRIDQTETGIDVIYSNYIDGIPIEESYIICTLTDGKITKFKRFWLDPVEVSDTEKEVIPVSVALIKFMSECTKEEETDIQDISLVFWLDSSAFDVESPVTDTALPAWRITYDGERKMYVPAWEQ